MTDRPPQFFRQWRQHRGYSLERVAEIAGFGSPGYLSDLEKGKRRYNQDILEALAIALQCSPADLLMRDPTAPDPFTSIWDQVPETSRPQALEVLKTFAPKTGTGG